MDLTPTTLVIELAPEPREGNSHCQHAYKDKHLRCARCGCDANHHACDGGCAWVLPGLCTKCAPYVRVVTVAARTEPARSHSYTQGGMTFDYPD